MNLLLKKYNKIIFQKKYDCLGYSKPVIDRCINCGNLEQAHAQITVEYEGSLNSGPICKKCYASNRGPRIAQF